MTFAAAAFTTTRMPSCACVCP